MLSSSKGKSSRTTFFTDRQYSVAGVWLNVPTGFKAETGGDISEGEGKKRMHSTFKVTNFTL